MIESFTLDKNFVLTSLKDTEWRLNKKYGGFEIPLSTFSNFDSSLLENLKFLVTESSEGRRTYLRKPSYGVLFEPGEFIIEDDKFIFKPYPELESSASSSKGGVVVFNTLSVYELNVDKLDCPIPTDESKYAIINLSNYSSATVKVSISSGDVYTSVVLPYNSTVKYTLASTGSSSVEIKPESIPIYINTEIYSAS